MCIRNSNNYNLIYYLLELWYNVNVVCNICIHNYFTVIMFQSIVGRSSWASQLLLLMRKGEDKITTGISEMTPSGLSTILAKWQSK